MVTKASLSLALVICSWAFVGFCQGQSGDGSGNPACVAKLLPCQPYLGSDKSPSAICCLPLKDLVANDVPCLCKVISNELLLKQFNITQDDAIELAKTCGAKADMNLCKTADAPTASPTTPTGSNNSTNNHTTAASPAKGKDEDSGASLITHYGGSLSIATLLLGLIMSYF